MLYVIVDIETTGGYAAASGITEIAAIVTDGSQVINEFHTLLNPHYTIPRYIEYLTGITNEMVEYERDFNSIADELFELLHDKIFVAHNVNFDYSFIKHHLQQCGYELNCKKNMYGTIEPPGHSRLERLWIGQNLQSSWNRDRRPASRQRRCCCNRETLSSFVELRQ